MAALIETSHAFLIHLKPPVDIPIAEQIGWKKKIISADTARRMFRGKEWILLTGCFDGKELNRGSLALIQALVEIAPVVVGVESDSTLWWNKGMFRPYFPQDKRVERLAQRPEVANVIPFGDVVFYNHRYDSRISAASYLSRYQTMQPSMVPVYCGDPSNPYSNSINGNAKRIGATRLVYDYFPASSTSRSLGY